MNSPELSIGLKERIVFTVAAIGVGLAVNFGIDLRGRVVNAANTTPTPTGTATPNALATQLAVEQTAVAGLRRQQRDLDTLATVSAEKAELERQIRERINVLNGTPVPTTTPSATPTWTAEQIEIKRRAGLITNTPTPRPRPTEAIPPETRSEPEKGLDLGTLGLAVGGILGIVGGAVVFRRRIMDLVRRIPHS